jgi:hypothetical protein
VAYQTQPLITSLIPNPSIGNIGMTVDEKKMHIVFSFMRRHAILCTFSRSKKSRYAKFVLSVSCTMELEQVRTHPAAIKGRGIIFYQEYSWPCSNYSKVGILFHA